MQYYVNSLLSLFSEKSNIVNYLNPEAKEALDTLLNIDRNRTLEKRVLPARFHVDEVSVA